jgi:hypothetical protein
MWFRQRIEQVIDSAEELRHQLVQLDARGAKVLVFLDAPLDLGALGSADIVAAPLPLL